jgi:hypothetical protein
MKTHHNPHHWVAVALVLAAALLTLSEAHGQQSGAAAQFEGRPAMAGAQGGLGAQAGPPQGGLGVQGNEVAERSMQLRKPSGLDEMQQARRAGEDVVAAADGKAPAAADAAKETTASKDVAPARDKSLAKEQRSTKKASRAVKRSISRARHGNAPVDAGTALR